ncbi:peptidase family M3 domain-containing protein [Trichoderma sp. SZMC 28014]
MGIRDTVSRERFKEIQGRLSQIQAEFRKNLGCQADEIFMTLAELDGVPEFLVKQLENNSSNNMLRIELSHPVHEGILWFAEKSETRKKFDKEAESVDLAVLWSKSRREIGLIDGQGIFDGHYAEGHGYSTFSHLMITDYTVGYYAYLYSKVYAADLFYSEFQDHILDTERVQRYRKCVLESGGSKDGFQNLIDFLGREPQQMHST